MTVEIKVLSGVAIGEYIEQLAHLRLSIFKEWPYLYNGSHDFEEKHLRRYACNVGAVIVGAFEKGVLVGAASGQPLIFEYDEFRKPLSQNGHRIEDLYFIGDLMIEKAYRGLGYGQRLIEEAERHACELGFSCASMCTVIRPDDHPRKPQQDWNYASFLQKRSYSAVEGAIVSFPWKDIESNKESRKLMQVWMCDLNRNAVGSLAVGQI